MSTTSLHASTTRTESKDPKINHNDLHMWQEPIVLRMQPVSGLSDNAEISLTRLLLLHLIGRIAKSY